MWNKIFNKARTLVLLKHIHFSLQQQVEWVCYQKLLWKGSWKFSWIKKCKLQPLKNSFLLAAYVIVNSGQWIQWSSRQMLMTCGVPEEACFYVHACVWASVAKLAVACSSYLFILACCLLNYWKQCFALSVSCNSLSFSLSKNGKYTSIFLDHIWAMLAK